MEKTIFSGLLAAIITAPITLIITIINNNKSQHRATHGESNWRSKLLELCETEEVKKKDLYSLRAFVRPIPKLKFDTKKCTLKGNDANLNMDDLVITFCEYTSSHFYSLNNKTLSSDFRMLCRILLKYDWLVQRNKDTPRKIAELVKYAKENLHSVKIQVKDEETMGNIVFDFSRNYVRTVAIIYWIIATIVIIVNPKFMNIIMQIFKSSFYGIMFIAAVFSAISLILKLISKRL